MKKFHENFPLWIKICIVAIIDIAFYAISYKYLIIPTDFMKMALLVCINMLVLNMCVRFYFIKEYRCYCKKEDKNSFLQFFESYFGENTFILIISIFNILINVLLLMGWLKVIFATFIIPFFQFLSTQVKY